jgi:serine/threonine-protein kinase
VSTRDLSDAAIRHLRETIDRPDAGERFEVQALIGKGGMGRVYQVHDRLLGRDVALKVLSLDAETASLAERLGREARVLAQLEHPGIAAIHDAGTLTDGRPYYLMRLVRGVSLADPTAIRTRGERLRVFLRICDAVSFAHARGIVHRDLKPGNVMIGEFGDVVVLDWGVAKVLRDTADVASSESTDRVASDDETRDGVVVGTPGFMAPEQAAGSSKDVDGRSDVYSLGALLQFLLSAGETSPVPHALSAIIARATAREAASRYPEVTHLADDVRRWLDAEPVSAYRETVAERVARWYTRNRTLVLLLLSYAVVRVTILVWRGV